LIPTCRAPPLQRLAPGPARLLQRLQDGVGGAQPRVVGLAHFSRYFASQNTVQLMTASMFHVTNLTPGSGQPCRVGSRRSLQHRPRAVASHRRPEQNVLGFRRERGVKLRAPLRRQLVVALVVAVQVEFESANFETRRRSLDRFNGCETGCLQATGQLRSTCTSPPRCRGAPPSPVVSPPQPPTPPRARAPPYRVALTPGGCQIGYMDHAGCHHLCVLTACKIT
jgi:hypothetical protein